MTTFKEFLSFESKPFKRFKPKKGMKKGGYPFGTRKGDGGLAFAGGVGISGSGGDAGGGMSEALIAEAKFRFSNTAPVDDDSVNVEPATGNDQPDSLTDEDYDRQGLIRVVKGAHLVYKRQTAEGTYEEMWVYDIGEHAKSEVDKKTAILAGTDIDPQTGQSEDGSQQYDLWTVGTAQILVITGLPN